MDCEARKKSLDDASRSIVTTSGVIQLNDTTTAKIGVEQSGTMNKEAPEEKSDNTSELPRLAYTMEETAKILGVSYITIHRLLKRGLHGTYVSVEPFHLFRYLDEQAFRFNNRKGTDAMRFVLALKGILNKRLTYTALTGSELPQTC